MYLNMLRYRLMAYPGPVRGHLTLGDPSAVEFVTSRLESVLPNTYRFHKECGLTVLKWDFIEQTKPTLFQLTSELLTDASNEIEIKSTSGFDLLASVIARGTVHGHYGNTYWGREYETLHLLLCGIDWSERPRVESNTWTNFVGTFAENDDRQEVLSTQLHCRCIEQVEVEFGLEPPSLDQMICALGAGELERIFDV
jgi:hypothetical protein